jgi:hypothetical protein
MPRPRLLLASAPLLAALCAVAPARAADGEVPLRRTGFDVIGDQLTVSVAMPDLFGPDQRARLTSGFATTVLVRVLLYRGDDQRAVATAYRRGEIVYDIWDETFHVLVSDQTGQRRLAQAATADRAIALAASLWHFPIVPLAALEPGVAYRVGVRCDLNPLSEELVADVRRRLVRPSSPRGGESFFGSFVSIFINPRIEESERQLRFLSQPVVPAAATAVRTKGAP